MNLTQCVALTTSIGPQLQGVQIVLFQEKHTNWMICSPDGKLKMPELNRFHTMLRKFKQYVYHFELEL